MKVVRLLLLNWTVLPVLYQTPLQIPLSDRHEVFISVFQVIYQA